MTSTWYICSYIKCPRCGSTDLIEETTSSLARWFTVGDVIFILTHDLRADEEGEGGEMKTAYFREMETTFFDLNFSIPWDAEIEELPFLLILLLAKEVKQLKIEIGRIKESTNG